MKLTQLFAPTLKEDPKEAEVISHKLLLRAGYIRKLASGIYDFLPLGIRSLRKIEAIIRDEMNRSGAQEVLLPVVQPSEIWQESGRWSYYGPELLRIKDRNSSEFCLGPTHEEVVTHLVGNEIHSYRQLPLNLYQIQTKFRDEIRPRAGLMRAREFIMKDAYSFHSTAECAREQYQIMYSTYERIFHRCGIKFIPVEADTGNVGGNMSHEFQAIINTGEDSIVNCSSCGYAANIEKAEMLITDTGKSCGRCGNALELFRGIEVGQVFYLGTKYSKAMNATTVNNKGEKLPMYMGCYGIGVSRILAAIIEQNYDENGIIWPMAIAPYQVIILPIQISDESVMETANFIYKNLQSAGVDVLFDDRGQHPGAKFKDADLLGIPLRITVSSRGLKNGEIEVKHRRENKATLISLNEVIDMIQKNIKNEGSL